MKHLLNGVAIAAALVIAVPAWAQNAPMSPSAPKAAAAPAKAMPAAAPAQKHHAMRHHAMRHHVRRSRMAGGDGMTEQLNRQELQRLGGGAGAPRPVPQALQG